VNEIYETFESDINTIFDKHVPIKEMYRIMLWQSLIPVVKFKVLKHRDFEFLNITSKSEFLQFFMKHVGSFIRLQRSNSSIKSPNGPSYVYTDHLACQIRNLVNS
jgi:hypothetical protein